MKVITIVDKEKHDYDIANAIAGGDVDIPTDEHINELIDAKLGVIENGTY